LACAFFSVGKYNSIRLPFVEYLAGVLNEKSPDAACLLIFNFAFRAVRLVALVQLNLPRLSPNIRQSTTSFAPGGCIWLF
jgi:hypothetical protein